MLLAIVLILVEELKWVNFFALAVLKYFKLDQITFRREICGINIGQRLNWLNPKNLTGLRNPRRKYVAKN